MLFPHTWNSSLCHLTLFFSFTAKWLVTRRRPYEHFAPPFRGLLTPPIMAPPNSQANFICEPTSAGGSGERRISRVPCKARGISENHTAWNAYIDIPLTAVHGDELACSNDICAGSGRRFRYCAMCALPVAHRNFVKRHGHGMIGPRGQQVATKRSTALVNDEDYENDSKRARMQAPLATSNSTVISPRNTPSTNAPNNIPHMVIIPIVATATDEHTARERAFLDLMKTRPVDESPELGQWIQKVLDTTTSKVVTIPTEEGPAHEASADEAVVPAGAFLNPAENEPEYEERHHSKQRRKEPQEEGDDCSSIGSTFLNEMVGV